ncbi:MAG: hypothetical protein ACM3NQ_20020 [Bacteroidales bacterium]
MSDITARDIERVWQQKSEEDLLEAAAQLGDYTPEGQRAIRSELKRRGLEDPVEQVGEAALDATSDGAPPRECTHCNVPLRRLGAQTLAGHDVEVFACADCGRVELFLSLVETDAEDEQEEEGTAS